MKRDAVIQGIGWGVWLIAAGVAIVLAGLAEANVEGWVAIVAGGIFSALAVYLTGPAREQSPARLVDLAIIAGLAVVSESALLAIGYGATYVLIAVALPMLVAGLRRPHHRWLLLIVVALVALAVLIPLIETGHAGVELIFTYLFAAAALPFVIAWFTGREGSWVLWIAYSLVAIGLLFPLTETDQPLGRYAVTYMLAATALPLLVSSLVRRRWGGTAFVGYVLLALALRIPLVEEGVMAERYSGAYLLLAAALGLLAAYLRGRESQWLPVLAGTTGAAGIALLFSQDAITVAGAAVLMIAGLGVVIHRLSQPEEVAEQAHAEPR